MEIIAFSRFLILQYFNPLQIMFQFIVIDIGI